MRPSWRTLPITLVVSEYGRIRFFFSLIFSLKNSGTRRIWCCVEGPVRKSNWFSKRILFSKVTLGYRNRRDKRCFAGFKKIGEFTDRVGTFCNIIHRDESDSQKSRRVDYKIITQMNWYQSWCYVYSGSLGSTCELIWSIFGTKWMNERFVKALFLYKERFYSVWSVEAFVLIRC